MLNGKTIRLRAMCDDDAEAMLEWRSDPALYEYFYECVPLSIDTQVQWIRDHMNEPRGITFIAESKDTGGPVGMGSILSIDLRNRTAEYARMLISKECQGKGFAREFHMLIFEYVFDHLGVNRLWLEIIADNEKMIGMHKRSGFKVDGVLRQHKFKGGQFIDVLIMSMLAEEYRKA